MKKTIKEAYEWSRLYSHGKIRRALSCFWARESEGKEALIKDGISAGWAEAIAGVAEKNIKEKKLLRTWSFCFNICSWRSQCHKKSAWIQRQDMKGVEIKYISAPKFKLTVTGSDYPAVEARLAKIIKSAEEIIKKIRRRSQGWGDCCSVKRMNSNPFLQEMQRIHYERYLPVCGSSTIDPKPPKFSPLDKWGKYRGKQRQRQRRNSLKILKYIRVQPEFQFFHHEKRFRVLWLCLRILALSHSGFHWTAPDL